MQKQKIIVAIDAINFKEKNLLFPLYIAKLNNAKLVGVFLEKLVYDPNPEIKRVYGFSYVEEITSDAEETAVTKKAIKDNMQRFKDVCAREGVDAIVHLDRGMVMDQIIEESRYADLIIAHPDLSFSKETDSFPSKFVKTLMANTECPVLIAPEEFGKIDEVIFAYDGSKSAALAIKQFSYLFPSFSEKMITVLHVSEDESDVDEHREKLSEWLTLHYRNVNFEVLSGAAEDELFKHLFGQINKILVMGAYGRNMFSMFFKPSTADLVLKSVDIPVFVAHPVK